MRMRLHALAAGFLGFFAAQAMAQTAPPFTSEAKPTFQNCGDDSLAKAQKDGLTLGLSVFAPQLFLDPSTNEPAGIDWEIQKAALNWMEINNVKYVWLPWETMIPSLLSKRIDAIGGDLHYTTERESIIGFTGPAYWYGPVIIVAKGNPLNISSYADLKDKAVGGITGAAADYILRQLKANFLPFTDHTQELQSLNEGRLQAVLEDDIIFTEYAKNNPAGNLQPLWSIPVPPELLHGQGYGYARFAVRKDDCTLRAAYTQALAEIRANGNVSFILKKYNLNDRNLFDFGLKLN